MDLNLLDHSHSKTTDVELEPAPDGTLGFVLVVETDLPLSDAENGYDEAKLADFVKAVQGYIREHPSFTRARIRRAT